MKNHFTSAIAPRVGFALAFAAIFSLRAIALGGGMAHNANFTVLAADQALAEAILERAELYRAQVSREWLGEELPPSVGPTVITVVDGPAKDHGFTWAVDRSSPAERKYHKVWISGPPERLLGGLLCHEVAHTVLATQYPQGIPAWLDEGIASRYDDDERKSQRSKIIAWQAKTGNWPRLQTLFQSPQIIASDQAAYSVAASVVDYLLSLESPGTLVQFSQAGERDGWDAALRQHYAINGIADLQSRWQAWTGKANALAQASNRHLR